MLPIVLTVDIMHTTTRGVCPLGHHKLDSAYLIPLLLLFLLLLILMLTLFLFHHHHHQNHHHHRKISTRNNRMMMMMTTTIVMLMVLLLLFPLYLPFLLDPTRPTDQRQSQTTDRWSSHCLESLLRTIVRQTKLKCLSHKVYPRKIRPIIIICNAKYSYECTETKDKIKNAHINECKKNLYTIPAAG